ERVLGAVLGQVPVPRQPDQDRHHPPPLLVERLGDGGLDLGLRDQNGLPSRALALGRGRPRGSGRSSHWARPPAKPLRRAAACTARVSRANRRVTVAATAPSWASA